MIKISKNDATYHSRKGVDGYYYQLPTIQNGTTIAYAEFSGEHGERTIGEKERIYYILEGKGEIEVNGEKTTIKEQDLVVIPSYGTYNLWPINGILKVLLYMEYVKLDK